MKLSNIAWADYSGGNANFIRGCTPTSEGCANCYARAIYDRFGLDFTPTFDEQRLERLRRQTFPRYSPKRGAPYKPMVFVCDTGDLFHESIPDQAIALALDMMASRTDVTWQILTKRIERMKRVLWYMGECWPGDSPYNVVSETDPSGAPPNIWLGVTVENQARADERIPLLLATPAAARFVSVEPCLERVDIEDYLYPVYNVPYPVACQLHPYYVIDDYVIDEWMHYRGLLRPALDWIIVGAESGPHRRPFDVTWAEDLNDRCCEAGVAFFGKQDSGLRPGAPLLIYGREEQEWPVL